MKAPDFKRKKQAGEKISMITCYDYPSARLAADTPIDCLLVGDSLAMTVHGHPATHHATLDMMTLHTQAVARGLGPQFLITDMPFLSYHGAISHTLSHVQTLIQAGAHAVKLEGGNARICRTISHLTDAGIAIIGHLGLTPQALHQLGGYRVQGKQPADANRLIAEAIALEKAGCLAIVLECIPSALTQTITQQLSLPTIGIGAGPHADGQVLVWHDFLGLHTDIHPKFAKQFARCSEPIQKALYEYHHQITNTTFPTLEHTYL